MKGIFQAGNVLFFGNRLQRPGDRLKRRFGASPGLAGVLSRRRFLVVYWQWHPTWPG
jgi:hypothetical protein